jgi:hypothetical protein
LINSDSTLIEKDNSFNVNLMNFICMLVMFVMNGIFIIILNSLESEADYKVITPEDYTLMISDIPDTFETYDQLKDDVLDIHSIVPLEINLTYKVSEYMKKKTDFRNYKKQLRMMHNKGIDQMKTGCCGKIVTKQDIARNIIDIDCELNEIIDTFEDEEKTRMLFTGTVFATFKDVTDYDAYRQFFPINTLSKIVIYLEMYVFCCCINDRKLRYLKKSLSLTVEPAPEPSDIKWENLEVTNHERRWRTFIVLVAVFFVLCFSFGVLLGISFIQKQISSTNTAAKYIVSLIFACVINMFNWIITKLMMSLTNYEANVSQTNYLLSFSLKLLFFTFINSAPLTIAVNAIAGNWENKQVLVNNVFFIFLMNSISTPLMYLVNPWYWYRQIQRNGFDKKVKEDANYKFDQTQQELNRYVNLIILNFLFFIFQYIRIY